MHTDKLKWFCNHFITTNEVITIRVQTLYVAIYANAFIQIINLVFIYIIYNSFKPVPRTFIIS